MATRIIPFSLLVLTTALSACALEPMDPGDDPTGEQGSTLTATQPAWGEGQFGQSSLPGAGPTEAENQSPSGLPGDNLLGGQDPDKPQPDPWVPGSPRPLDGVDQSDSLDSYSSAGTRPIK